VTAGLKHNAIVNATGLRLGAALPAGLSEVARRSSARRPTGRQRGRVAPNWAIIGLLDSRPAAASLTAAGSRRQQQRRQSRERLPSLAADRAALPLSGYVRSVLLQAPPPRQVRRPPIEKQLLGKMVGQLGRLGNNLNQLTRLANEGRIVPPQTLGMALDDVRRLVDAIAKALGHDY